MAKKKLTPAQQARLESEMAVKTAEEQAGRMISGGDMPAMEQANVNAARRPSGIAGTEILIDDKGNETLVYQGTDRPVTPGVAANIGSRTPSGIAGTEYLIDDKGKQVLVYTGTTNPVVPGTPAPKAGETPKTTTSSSPTKTWTATDGTVFYDQKSYGEYQDYISGRRADRQSAFDLLYQEFSSYGLGSLVEPLRGLIQDPSVSSSEFTIRLRGTEAYKKRFGANAKRIAKGLSAISEAEYLGLEDQYQNIMRRYGMPNKYYSKSELGVQPVFENLISSDVSSVELEDRVQTAYDRVINAAPEVKASLREFYPNITDGDILAYSLDPENALNDIKRKVTAAEIGAGAAQAGLLGKTPQERAAYAARAEELARLGVTGEQARAGFQTVAAVAPRARQLSAIYGEDPLTQLEVESEVFGTTGAVEARKKRERLVGREQAAFSGSAGTTQGALARERAGQL